MASCELGASCSTESSRRTTRSLPSAGVRSWSPRSTPSPSASGVHAVVPACRTSACPSIAATTPTCSCADDRAAPRTIPSAVRASTSRYGAGRRMSVRKPQLRLDDVSVVLEDVDVRRVHGPVVAERDGDVRHDRPLHAGRELVDDVLTPLGVVSEAVRLGVVLVAEEVHQIDVELPSWGEGNPGVDLVVAVAVVGSGARPRPLATPLVAERCRAVPPVDRLTEARRVSGSVPDVLEWRAQIRDVAVTIEHLRQTPAGLGVREKGRDEGLAGVAVSAEGVALITDLHANPQLRPEAIAGRPLDAVRKKIEVVQAEVHRVVEVVCEA